MNEKLNISSAFTVEDIHKIRVWNFERRKNMTDQEVIKDTEKGANAFEVLVELAREHKTLV